MIILISTYNSQNYVFLRAIVIAFCGMDFDFYKIIKIIFILKIAATLFVLLMYGFGLTTTFSEEFRQFSETWGLFRNSFGFYHPNQTGIQIFSICAMLICLRYEVLNIKDYIFILGLCLLNFFFIGSRTSLFMCIILLVATDLCKRNKGKVFKNKAFKFILTSFPFIMVLILFLQIFILPKYEIFSFLNLTTSGRLYNNILAYHNIPISFLGSKVIFWDFNLVMDNDYMYSLIVRGVLPTAIMMALYSSMLSKLLKSGRFILVVIAVCFLIYGYSENISFHIQHNFALIWLLSDSRIFDFDSDSNTKNEKLIGAA
jgi:hypothetical protein